VDFGLIRESELTLGAPNDQKRPPRAGQVGGKKTAKRGLDYFRKIAAMRKEFKGARLIPIPDDITTSNE
jgi:hypothetical protein